jgi:large subunit ribosomal protein L7/L12
VTVAKSKIGTEDLLEQFKEMTLLELSEFIKAFEETFDVTAAAAAPMMVAAPGGAAAGDGGTEEEQSEFDVILTSAGDKKIQVIKEVRALTSLGLKEAKDLVDGAPKPVLERVNKEAADKAKEQLEAAGGSVEVK